MQAALGITTVLTKKSPFITSLHVATGAAILGYATLLALRALPLKWEIGLLTNPDPALHGLPTQKVQT